ncbi:zinc finger swim domain-containing protein [Anaeramoeba ignava]|uniref:Zinc finger swim domain-containing protein n=1 Tax=Anaeramoeba ignava TaxID=1746090 RepID=A0A9Q0RC74_ANAIG|nr:zinc finger swim domain-containing protein [Anaeramoeba ignava]
MIEKSLEILDELELKDNEWGTREITAEDILEPPKTLPPIIKIICSNSEKFFYKFGNNPSYIIFQNNYCTCPSFYFQVIKKKTQSLCKHQLTIKLANYSGMIKSCFVSEEEYTNILSKNLEISKKRKEI